MSTRSRRRREAWPLVLLFLFGGMGLCAAVSFGIEARGAVVHPAVEGMLRGGAVPAPGLVGVAWLFGALLLAVVVVFLAVAARGGARGRSGIGALVVVGVLLQVSFAAIVLTAGGSGWGPGPLGAATGWFLLVFFPLQVLVVVHYVAGFGRVWSAESEARFARLLEREGREP